MGSVVVERATPVESYGITFGAIGGILLMSSSHMGAENTDTELKKNIREMFWVDFPACSQNLHSNCEHITLLRAFFSCL